MSYSGLLFNQIPYEVKENDEPIYQESLLESYLLAHYLGNKKDLLNDVISIFHDDKHSGNMMTVNTRKTKGTFWYPASNCEEIENFEDDDPNAVGFIFQIDYLQENIVKRVCAKLGITQKELAEIMKINDVTVRNWSSKGQIPESSISFMECLIENKNLKKENEEIKQALSILKKYS
ncbi:hypothetical protein [Aliarcobacter butzleri]|uniref:hypothetical protein n=1 Tax=Aliarcobacter butzleri TaxID=28197 RepID=UPI003AF800F4